MGAHRFFLTRSLPAGRTTPIVLPLADDDVRHAVDVLRVRAGELLEVVEPGSQTAWLVKISHAGATQITATVVEQLERVHHPRVTLVQGVAKGDKMDAIVRQAVELGVEAIVPVITERSVVRLEPRKRAHKGDRWRRVAKAAAEQSHRFEIPTVADPASLREVRPQLAELDGVVVLWEDASQSAPGLEAALESLVRTPDLHIGLVIGPEGGLSAEEVAELESIGARSVTLGPHILRTETAAVVAVALAVHALGGLGRD